MGRYRNRRTWLIVLCVVLVMVAGGGAIYWLLRDSRTPWVASSSNFDTCSLVTQRDVNQLTESLSVIDSLIVNNDALASTGDGLEEQCSYALQSRPAQVILSLSVSEWGSDDSQGERQEVSGLGNDVRLTQRNDDTVMLIFRKGNAKLQLASEGASSSRMGITQGNLENLGKKVYSRTPETFKLPGMTAKGECLSTPKDLVQQVHHEKVVYSRSSSRGNKSSIADCYFGSGGGDILSIKIERSRDESMMRLLTDGGDRLSKSGQTAVYLLSGEDRLVSVDWARGVVVQLTAEIGSSTSVESENFVDLANGTLENAVARDPG